MHQSRLLARFPRRHSLPPFCPRQPVLCEGFLDEKLKPPSAEQGKRPGRGPKGAGASGTHNAELTFDEADAEAYGESLQLTAWLLKVCDVLLVVQDWTPDLELWQ